MSALFPLDRNAPSPLQQQVREALKLAREFEQHAPCPSDALQQHLPDLVHRWLFLLADLAHELDDAALKQLAELKSRLTED